jgi:hypothetical protein
MDKKEIDKIKWGNVLDAEVPQNLLDESLSILNAVEERKVTSDVVNWDERKEMEEASKRNPGFISKEDKEKKDIKSNIKNQPEEKETPKNKMEEDLFTHGAELINFMEDNDVRK